MFSDTSPDWVCDHYCMTLSVADRLELAAANGGTCPCLFAQLALIA